jgi:glycosyltransferase involved in cell wall biosynthesis
MRTVQVPRRFVRHAWGGTETVILETSRRLPALGHETEILCPNALAEADEETIDGVRVRRTGYFYPYLGLSAEAKAQLDRKAGNLVSFPLLREILARPGLDLVHLHTGKRLGGMVRTAARLRGIPYVVSLHGGVHDVPAEEARTWTEPTAGAWEWGKALGWCFGSRRVLDDAAAILCVGEGERRLTQARYPAKRVEYLPNGVDVALFARGDGRRFRAARGIAAEAELLMVVARVDPQKNQALAIHVLKALADERPRLQLVLAGPVTDPAYAASLRASARAQGLGDRVHFLEDLRPRSQDLVDAYHAAALVLLPSIHEPFGIVTLEAWAAGRAVAASRTGGVPFLVEDGVDGVLLDPSDAAGWVRTVRALLAHGPSRDRLAASGRRKAAAEYDWDRITGRLAALYDDVARGARQSASDRGLPASSPEPSELSVRSTTHSLIDS